MSLEDRPEWLHHGHDHICKIPFTKSYVFYPYNPDEVDKEYLNELYNKHGYTVVRRPKSESEYSSMQHQTYKVLILEPDFDQLKIDKGCNLIAEYFRDMWKKQHMDIGEQ